MLVHRYRLHDHADYRLTVKETLTLKPDGFTLTLTPRTSADRVHGPLPGAVETSVTPTADTATLPARVRPGTSALFLHGSNYGTCREFAAQLADEAAGLGSSVEVAPLDAYAEGLPTDRPVVITSASYNGRPTDDALVFAAWLEEPHDLTGVTYAVLGVGDRNWAATYQHMPTRIDARLAELGATRPHRPRRGRRLGRSHRRRKGVHGPAAHRTPGDVRRSRRHGRRTRGAVPPATRSAPSPATTWTPSPPGTASSP